MTPNDPGDRLRNLAIANRQLITRLAGNRFPDEGKEIRIISALVEPTMDGTQEVAISLRLVGEKKKNRSRPTVVLFSRIGERNEPQ